MWLNYNLEIYRWSRSWSVSVVLYTSWLGTRTCETPDMQQHGVFSIPMSDGFLPDPLTANWIWFKQMTLITTQVCIVFRSAYTHSCFLVVRVQHRYYRPSSLLFRSASTKQRLSRSFRFPFRVLCSCNGGLPLGGYPWWIYLGRAGCPCVRYVQRASCLIPEMWDFFLQSGTALSSWIRMDLVTIGVVWLRLEIDSLTGRVCSLIQTKIHREEIRFVLCICSHKQRIKTLQILAVLTCGEGNHNFVSGPL